MIGGGDVLMSCGIVEVCGLWRGVSVLYILRGVGAELVYVCAMT